MQHSKQDKVAFVTGASRGIGQAIAHRLAEQGCCVIGTATTVAGAERITEAFSAAQLNGYGLVLDLRQPDQIQQSIAQVLDKHQCIDILVNNAGITRDNLLMRMSEEQWHDVITVNLSAVYLTSKACLRPMMRSKWGRIIQIGSVVGSMGNPGQSNYAAAKAGLIGFSKSLASEVASRHITVNVVAPGFIETDMTAALNEQQRQQIIERIPSGQLGQVADIADMVCFLASERANYITGQVLHVNGGLYMD